MVDITATTSPSDVVDMFYTLAVTLRDSGIPEEDLPSLEKIWLQRKDSAATVYHCAKAAFVAGFTGQPKPHLDAAEGRRCPHFTELRQSRRVEYVGA